MIRLLNFKKKAKNNFPLAERSIAAIQNFDTVNYFEPGDDPDEILEHFELLYELEYKYNRITHSPFGGIERRKDKIIEILERKSKNVIRALSETFKIVFDEWLRNHAITDPEQWARQRMYGDSPDSIIEMEGFDTAFGNFFMGELIRYRINVNQGEVISEVAINNPEIIDEIFLNDFIMDKQSMIIEELEDIEIEEFNDIYGDFFNVRFKTKEEARDWLETNFAGWDNDFINIFGTKKRALEFIIDELEETDFFKQGDPENFMDTEEFLLKAYEDILFPAWYDYWSGMGIDETRDRVEKVYDQLINIEKHPLKRQFMILNIAKNTNHQNGSMMEYYEETWEVDYDQLMKLSEMDVSEWNKELEEIGVIL